MNIAIVEVSESHEECIYSQVLFLKDAGHKVSLLVHPDVAGQITYSEVLDEIHIINPHSKSGWAKLKEDWVIAKKISGYDKAIFNTASSSKSIRNICLFLTMYKVEALGIIHSVTKLNRSFTQRLISFKVKKYYALNDFLIESLHVNNSNLSVSSFYPIFFPALPKQSLHKNPDDIWICVPGRVHYHRRNYSLLLWLLAEVGVPNAIKFIILGNINTKDGMDFREKLVKHNLLEKCILFNNFMPNALYHTYVAQSDYVMPLLNTNNEEYLTNKISGSFNLAFSYKKILLCHSFYKPHKDLAENGIFYDEETIGAVLKNLRSNPSLKGSYTHRKWNYAYQKDNFLALLEK